MSDVRWAFKGTLCEKLSPLGQIDPQAISIDSYKVEIWIFRCKKLLVYT